MVDQEPSGITSVSIATADEQALTSAASPVANGSPNCSARAQRVAGCQVVAMLPGPETQWEARVQAHRQVFEIGERRLRALAG